MQTLFRGTQYPGIKGNLRSLSFTDSLPVAVIWSAVPSDMWSNRKVSFRPTSTIHIVNVDLKNPLFLGNEVRGKLTPFSSLGAILRTLNYGSENGATFLDAKKILHYFHKRILGRTRGGDFTYLVLDEDGDEMSDDRVGFSLLSPETKFSVVKEDWENYFDEDDLESVADNVIADTFAFADSPTVQRLALTQGYDSLAYSDVFEGGKGASEELLGIPVNTLIGITMQYDVKSEMVPTHKTVRILDEQMLGSIQAVPTAEVLTAPWMLKG